MEILRLNIQLISGWIGSKIDVQKVLGQRERSETQFQFRGMWLGSLCVCVCVSVLCVSVLCVCFGETAAL